MVWKRKPAPRIFICNSCGLRNCHEQQLFCPGCSRSAGAVHNCNRTTPPPNLEDRIRFLTERVAQEEELFPLPDNLQSGIPARR